jgi:hypothetical protein
MRIHLLLKLLQQHDKAEKGRKEKGGESECDEGSMAEMVISK